MTIDWATLGYNILTVFLLLLVISGAMPVITTLVLFLAIPFHGSINNYRKSAPYLPRVAVLVPAWNEEAVIGATIDRFMSLEYPRARLRVYVIDDASTDATADVVEDRAARYPGAVFHLRRLHGGEGKAHTLNHGLNIVLGEDWAEAVLITDADVIYAPDSLRKLTRHLVDPEVGAVTAYVREGSIRKNYLTRFIAIEYVMAQAAARRAQNVLGAQACLAGGAQLHTRENLVAMGSVIDTSGFAEDTVTTFETQLRGKRVVFDPRAVVLAEEPGTVRALWKQRLRWARGNVEITARYRAMWFRPNKGHGLGTLGFGLAWFSIQLLPLVMILSSLGLLGLLLVGSDLANVAFRGLWVLAACTYFFSIFLSLQLDWGIGRRTLIEALFFPGIISMIVMLTAFFPGLFEEVLPSAFGIVLTDTAVFWWTVFVYFWISVSMLGGWLAKAVEGTIVGRVLTPVLVYVVGYGPILCAITVDSYIKEFRGAETSWDKTEKTGRVSA
ncbi:MAG TPA: glycosyltransferase [Rhodoglobus sp.]|nr:glycosyltransferase [Rhodoglobus sp.]